MSDTSGAVVGKRDLLEVRNLAVLFPINRGGLWARRAEYVHAVDGVSFSIRRGETLGLVGESVRQVGRRPRPAARSDRPVGLCSSTGRARGHARTRDAPHAPADASSSRTHTPA
jgi:hypothetical protein